MGMFDRLYDENGAEWQTKALGRSLCDWNVGDALNIPFDCMVEVIGYSSSYRWAYAEVRGKVFRGIREEHAGLPVIPYGGLLARYSNPASDPGPDEV